MIKYDPVADMSYLQCQEKGTKTFSHTVVADFNGQQVNIDVATDGSVIGVEFFGEVQEVPYSNGV